MSEWKKVPIKDVCVGIYDGPHATPPVSETGGIFLGISNITKDGHFDFSSIKYIGDDYMPKWTKRVTPQKDDIVFSYEATLNLYAVIPDGFYGCLGRRMALIRTNKQLVNHKYLFYYFFSKNWRNLISEKTIVGATVDRIPIATFPDFEIELPSLDVQNKIATILSRYDTLIENYQKQIKLLEESAQRLYKEWFVDLRFPGHENTKIVDGVPEGWKMISIDSLVGKLESGSRPKGGIDTSIKDGVASVGAENVIGLGQYNFSSKKLVSYDFYNNAKKGRIENKDILIYKDGAYIGRTSLFQDNFPHKEAMINEHVFLLHTKKEVNQYFLFFTLYQKVYFEKMQKLNKNAAQPGLNQNAIKSLKLLMPNEKLIVRFDEIISPMMKVLFDLANQIPHLTEARDRLLPKLMSGEIEV